LFARESWDEIWPHRGSTRVKYEMVAVVQGVSRGCFLVRFDSLLVSLGLAIMSFARSPGMPTCLLVVSRGRHSDGLTHEAFLDSATERF
jgi:hypothetical protein